MVLFRNSLFNHLSLSAKVNSSVRGHSVTNVNCLKIRAANDLSILTITEKAPTRDLLLAVKTDGSFAALVKTFHLTHVHIVQV